MAQRRADLKREAVLAPTADDGGKKPKSKTPSGSSRRRLTFNEKHALDTLPKIITKLQAEIAKLQRFLDDPNLYAKDRKKFDETSAALAKAQKDLEASEDKWLELEVLREEIEQA